MYKVWVWLDPDGRKGNGSGLDKGKKGRMGEQCFVMTSRHADPVYHISMPTKRWPASCKTKKKLHDWRGLLVSFGGVARV